MLRSTLSAVLVSLSIAALTGCSGGPDSDDGEGAPASGKRNSDSSKSSDESATEPTKGGDTESSIGPQCMSYLACCDAIAESRPALAGSCDSTRRSVEDAQEKGAGADSLESSCNQALATMQSAGYCE